MTTTDLTNPIFTDETKARAHFEALRWPDGRVCPHCGTIDNSTLLKGKSTRPGLYKCKDCQKPFSATMGTVYEKSHIPLHKWLLATHLMCASKKGMSATQLHRMLGFGSYRTAWFMAHRIREAMRSDDLSPMGSGGGYVEIDETFIGKNSKPFNPRYSRGNQEQKNVVLTLVSRKGTARSFHVDRASVESVIPVVRANLSKEARVITDESRVYGRLGKDYAHATVNHSAGQYAHGDISTNTVEGYFSIFKRGMKGVYQHCSETHLHRYLAEFDFRYSERAALGIDDKARAAKAVKGAVGKRLTYQQSNGQSAAQA